MKVKRIVSNVATGNPGDAQKFYQEVLGLDLLMDMDWIRTYGTRGSAQVQISFASQGGSDTRVPDISIEVDDLEEAHRRMQAAGFVPEYGPVLEPWGVTRFFVRDPFGRLVNILAHRPDPSPGSP